MGSELGRRKTAFYIETIIFFYKLNFFVLHQTIAAKDSMIHNPTQKYDENILLLFGQYF